jgi:hypothetical protein
VMRRRLIRAHPWAATPRVGNSPSLSANGQDTGLGCAKLIIIRALCSRRTTGARSLRRQVSMGFHAMPAHTPVSVPRQPRARRNRPRRSADDPGRHLAHGAQARARRRHHGADRQPLLPRDRITAYLANGGALEHAQSMAAHESPRTTKLYDRTKERLTQDEIERIVI